MREIRCASHRSDNQHKSINIRDDTEILQNTENQSVLDPGNITFRENYKETGNARNVDAFEDTIGLFHTR